jgi:NADH-quinone oxidoreductase subunit J
MNFFLVLAAIAVLSAFAVIFNKNVVHSALALLVNFSTVAVLYFTLNAQFLGIAQILVYAGAIVVLFLFVVMLLGADLGEKVSSWITWRNIVFIALGLILLTVVGTAVFENVIRGARGSFTQETVEQVGQTQAIAATLFTEYILPFQLVAVLLSVGVVGVVWLAQHQQRYGFGKVVAILDTGWADESQRKRNDLLGVNWLQRQSLFDFDRVEIVQATDEDVERFARQVGNDTNDWRRSGYRQMSCLISPDCILSESTIRLLQNTFGEVKIVQEFESYVYD